MLPVSYSLALPEEGGRKEGSNRGISRFIIFLSAQPENNGSHDKECEGGAGGHLKKVLTVFIKDAPRLADGSLITQLH